MNTKPPLPDNAFAPWPRVPVDADPGSDFALIERIGGFAAHAWAINDPAGPLKAPMPLMPAIDGAVREALMHLLELGLIDIDTERLHDAPGYPMHRER
ncbi:hypothetical protein ACFWG5_34605 [Streptomyces hydrogenans]|uniref:hypothetical protein n=1 Tax=Streptomyces TaxID=1883 RepID=UPI00363F72B0